MNENRELCIFEYSLSMIFWGIKILVVFLVVFILFMINNFVDLHYFVQEVHWTASSLRASGRGVFYFGLNIHLLISSRNLKFDNLLLNFRDSCNYMLIHRILNSLIYLSYLLYQPIPNSVHLYCLITYNLSSQMPLQLLSLLNNSRMIYLRLII